MTAPFSHFIELNGRRHHVAQWGHADAPTVVMVHGLRDHARSWDWVAAPLADRYRVIVPDLRGHGDSDWAGSYTMSDYVRDLAGVFKVLDLTGVHLVGHSLGGHIVLRFAGTYPERLASLCSIEGVELPSMRDHRRSPRPYPQLLREWIDREHERESRPHRAYPSQAAAQARMAQEHPAIAQDTLAHIVHHGMVRLGNGWRWKYDNACRYRAPDDVRALDLDEILSAITCPTMLAYGGASWVPVPPDQRLARIARRRLVHFPGAGHWLHHDSRAAFVDALGLFLNDPDHFLTSERPDHA